MKNSTKKLKALGFFASLAIMGSGWAQTTCDKARDIAMKSPAGKFCGYDYFWDDEKHKYDYSTPGFEVTEDNMPPVSISAWCPSSGVTRSPELKYIGCDEVVRDNTLYYCNYKKLQTKPCS